MREVRGTRPVLEDPTKDKEEEERREGELMKNGNKEGGRDVKKEKA